LSTVVPPDAVDLKWLVEAYTYRDANTDFFKTEGFTKHAGTTTLQKQIVDGMSAVQIRASWQNPIEEFKKIRAKYLIYD
jgi:uncharacterized protein YbbC (DUF1343 family)